jgi:hypothetical protein
MNPSQRLIFALDAHRVEGVFDPGESNNPDRLAFTLCL